MAYAAAISRLLRQAGCASFQVTQHTPYVSVWGPQSCTPELLSDYANAIPEERYQVKIHPTFPTRCLLVSNREK